MKTFNVDVEEIHEDPVTISIEQAIRDFSLDTEDIDLLKEGGIVWVKNRTVAISAAEPE